jgi:3-hydroxyisobutyrate dehydrogenase-like beta-hydroxyacid dehydrogenase
MSDVSVIGLGNMGSALARAFLDGGHRVTVWELQPGRYDEFVERGAKVADSPVAAVADSPITVVCILRYEHVREILDVPESAGVFPGHTIVNLCSGTPAEAVEARAWIEDKGADYFEGHIHVYPRLMGTEDAIVTYAGPQALWSRSKELLSSLGGSSTWVGEDIGSVNALAAVASIFYHVALAGLLEVAAFAREAGLPSDAVRHVMDGRIRLLEHGIPPTLQAVATRDYNTDQATVEVTLDAMNTFKRVIDEGGTSTALVTDAVRIFQAADAAGMGSQDAAAAVELMTGSDHSRSTPGRGSL